MFTGLRVGVTTAKVLAQALRVPMIPVPSLDLLAYPLRHARALVVPAIDARRNELYYALYRPVPGGVQRVSEYEIGTPDDLVAELEARGEEALLCGDGALRFADAFARRSSASSSRAPRTPRRASPRWPSWRSRATSAKNSAAPTTCCRCTCARATPSSRGTERTDDVATARKLIEPLEVHIAPMRRRHLRAVLRIESQVYPTPWTHALFVSELALRSTRVVRGRAVGREVSGTPG